MQESKEQKFLEFTKDDEAIHVSFLKNGVQVADILLGITATINMVMEETGKGKEDIFKVIDEMLEEARKDNKNKEGERKNGSVRETFTVRRISYDVGVERTFPIHSPLIDHVEVTRQGKTRRGR